MMGSEGADEVVGSAEAVGADKTLLLSIGANGDLVLLAADGDLVLLALVGFAVAGALVLLALVGFAVEGAGGLVGFEVFDFNSLNSKGM